MCNKLKINIKHISNINELMYGMFLALEQGTGFHEARVGQHEEGSNCTTSKTRHESRQNQVQDLPKHSTRMKTGYPFFVRVCFNCYTFDDFDNLETELCGEEEGYSDSDCFHCFMSRYDICYRLGRILLPRGPRQLKMGSGQPDSENHLPWGQRHF